MKDNQRHLLIIVTRLTAEKGEPRDEFVDDWIGLFNVPKKQIIDKDYARIDIEKSENVILIVHGYEELLSGRESENYLQPVLLRLLRDAKINHADFDSLWLFVHGEIAELGGRVEHIEDQEELNKSVAELTRKKNSTICGYSGEGNSPTQKLLDKLQQSGVPENFIEVIKAKTRVAPSVDRYVRQWQGALLELRLVKKLLEKADAGSQITLKKMLLESIPRLSTNINAIAVRRAAERLIGPAYANAQDLHLNAGIRSEFGEDPLSGMSEETQKAAAILFSDNNCANGDFSSIDDAVLRGMSARLELLVKAAQAYDLERASSGGGF